MSTPLWMQPAAGDPGLEYSALEDRAGLLSAVFSREGVLDVDAGQLKVTQRAAGANFSVDVAPGRAAIAGDDISDQGTYLCTWTVAENLATPQPPASGTRTHRVIARVRDRLHDGSLPAGTYDRVLEVLADDGTGLPALPGSAISLATVTMTASMVSVTDANIVNDPPRATTGTRSRTGIVSPYTGWTAPDSRRQPSYSITPDDWVLLSGWVRRSAASFTATSNTFYQFVGPVPDVINPGVSRDLPGSASGAVPRFNIDPTGVLYFVFFEDRIITQDASWFSLDGVSYRLTNT